MLKTINKPVSELQIPFTLNTLFGGGFDAADPLAGANDRFGIRIGDESSCSS
jgi:hypothetical protein